MVGFIYIKVMVNDGTDFQNLYSYRSFIYLRITLMAKTLVRFFFAKIVLIRNTNLRIF